MEVMAGEAMVKEGTVEVFEPVETVRVETEVMEAMVEAEVAAVEAEGAAMKAEEELSGRGFRHRGEDGEQGKEKNRQTPFHSLFRHGFVSLEKYNIPA